MSNARDEDIDFSWGPKKGRSGMYKDVQLYESFTCGGVEYFLYDSVFLYKDDEIKPCIGKLIEICELSSKARKVKLLWFFHTSDISNYLGGENVLQNEIFLASGCGKGLMTMNPLNGSRWMTASTVSIVWHGFGCDCTGKIVSHAAISSPHSGQAFAIFKTQKQQVK